MTTRVLAAASLAVSLAALIARTVALALADLDRGLRTYSVEIPSTVPEWMNEEAGL